MTDSFRAPGELRTDEFVLRPLRASDAALDHEAVMETKDSLRVWEQSGWPADDFTVEANREDLARLEARHDAGESFTYTLFDPDGVQCLGCVYIFPTSASLFSKAEIRPLGDAQWEDFDLVVYFWVRRSRWESALDERLVSSLEAWLRDEWRTDRALIHTSELFDRQVKLLAASGRVRLFELRYEEKPGKELAYAMPVGSELSNCGRHSK